MSGEDRSSLERAALRRSAIGYSAMGALGIGFAFLTQSDAILIDGVYSLVSLVMTFLAARVARLIDGGGSHRFHFGYAHFEPLLNTVRVAVILGIAGFAFLSAVESLINGGRPLNPGLAVFYGIGSAVICVSLSFIQRKTAEKVGSPILSVDARNWFVDGMLSSAVGFAFLVAFFLSRAGFSSWLPFVDPVLVIVMICMVVPVPLRALIVNLRQVLQVAPEEKEQGSVRAAVEAALEDFPHRLLSVRMVEIGRFFYVQVHVVVPEGSGPSVEIATLDRARASVRAALGSYHARPEVDVIFTADDRDALVVGGAESSPRRGEA